MSLHGPVLVGTDLSAAAAEALRQGAQLATALDSRLIVCHVVPELLPDGSVFQQFRDAKADWRHSIVESARAAVQRELDAVLGGDTSGIDLHLQFGTPHVGLLAQAEESGAGVVVIGPGSTAVDVVRHTAAAALVARRSPRGPVIASTDLSDASLPAVRAAAQEAARRKSVLHLLYAFDVAAYSAGYAPAAAMPYLAGSSAIALEGLDELQHVAQTRLDDTLRELGVPGETVVLTGSAARVIVRYAATTKAELLVVGTHGRSGLGRLTLGSTAASVVEHAPCSVLVVRAAARGQG